MSDGETRGEELAKGAARASGPEPRAKAKGFSVDLGVPVGAANAHLGDPCLYCETPTALVKPGPCPGAGDHGRAIVSLQRALDVNVRATRIALEKATTAIGTVCSIDVSGLRSDVDLLKRVARSAPAAQPDDDALGGSCEPGAVERLTAEIRAEVLHPRVLEVASGARSLAGAAAETIRLLRFARDEARRQRDQLLADRDAVKLNLGEQVERFKAEAEMAHRNRQRAQDEADRLRRFEAEREQVIREREPRDAALKDRLLKALAERDEARCEASEARAKVEELEAQFAEEQDANDAEEADAKAARAALEAAQADFAKLADFVARFESMPTGRGLPEVTAAIERVCLARERFERDRKLLKDDANLVPHLKSTLEEALKQRADLEARLVAAEGKAASGGDAEAAARLVTDLTTALGERDAARAALAEREARRGQGGIPLGWTAAVLSDTARLVRALEGSGVVSGTKGTTYGRAADVVERLKVEAAQARDLADKLRRDLSTVNTERVAAESRASDAARRVEVLTGSTGVREIAEERVRQVSREGFTSDHDDGHRAGELAWAAACYAAPGKVYRLRAVDGAPVDAFPWDAKWDKRAPEDDGTMEHHSARRRALVKAGALCAAELDRLDRSLPF